MQFVLKKALRHTEEFLINDHTINLIYKIRKIVLIELWHLRYFEDQLGHNHTDEWV